MRFQGRSIKNEGKGGVVILVWECEGWMLSSNTCLGKQHFNNLLFNIGDKKMFY